MKHTILLLTGLTFIIASTGCNTTIRVNSAQELINAIGSNRTIELAPGDYIISNVKDRHMDSIRWDPEFDGKTITIRNVKNLKIVGRHGKFPPPRLLAQPRYVYVLNFQECNNIKLENLILGHSPNPGHCTSGVIGATNCTNLTLDHCDLFGCGTEGLTLTNVKDMTFHNSTIRDCTYGIMTIKSCNNLQFTQSIFKRNKEFWAVNIHDSKNALFTNCNFTNNQAEDQELFQTTSSSNILLKDCTFTNNKVKSITNNTTAVTIDTKEIEAAR